MPRNFDRGFNGNAVGECARSARKMRLSDMVEDGYYPGLLVDPRWREPEEPQEVFVQVADDAAVEWPAPENHSVNVEVLFPTYNDQFALNPVHESTVEVGRITVEIISLVVLEGQEADLEMGTLTPVVAVNAGGQESDVELGTMAVDIAADLSGQEVAVELGAMTVDIDETFFSSGAWSEDAWGE